MDTKVVLSTAMKRRKKADRPMELRYQYGLRKFLAMNRLARLAIERTTEYKHPYHTSIVIDVGRFDGTKDA